MFPLIYMISFCKYIHFLKWMGATQWGITKVWDSCGLLLKHLFETFHG